MIELKGGFDLKVKFWILIIAIVVIAAVSSFIFLMDNNPTVENELEYVTFKEFKDSFSEGDIKSGDIIHIRDTFSDVYFKSTPPSGTHLSFMSMEGNRVGTYDICYYEGDITHLYGYGNNVTVILEITYFQLNEDDSYSYSYIIENIEHA